MAKKSHTNISRVFKYFFDVRSWSDFDRMRTFTNYLLNGFKKFFILPKNTSENSFNEMVIQYKLTEQDLIVQQKSLLRLSIIMLALAVVIFGYVIYCVIYGSWRAVFLSWIVMSLSLVLAFRYHFWYFQLNERRLGCSIKDWLVNGLGIKK